MDIIKAKESMKAVVEDIEKTGDFLEEIRETEENFLFVFGRDVFGWSLLPVVVLDKNTCKWRFTNRLKKDYAGIMDNSVLVSKERIRKGEKSVK